MPHQQTLLEILDGIGLVFIDTDNESSDGGNNKNNNNVYSTPIASLLVSITAPTKSISDSSKVGGNVLETTAAHRSLSSLHENNTRPPSAPAVNGSTSTSTANASMATRGHVIVETNFRIYAYTDSPIDIAILSMFIQPTVRLVIFLIIREFFIVLLLW